MKKNMIWVWVLIVVLVIGFLVYITINKKPDMADEEKTTMQNENSGVKITVITEGSGEAAVAGDTVSMNYTGTLTDGTAFDSNVDPKFNHVQPFSFVLGSGQVIPGWDTGIVGMKVGEKRILEIAPEMAYGANGVGGVIPPNATLIFEVELVSITK